MHPSCIRKNTDPVRVHAGKQILTLAAGILLIPLISLPVYGFHITKTVHQVTTLPSSSIVFLPSKDRFLRIFQSGPALPSKLFFHRVQLIHDRLSHGIIVIQQVLILGYVL